MLLPRILAWLDCVLAITADSLKILAASVEVPQLASVGTIDGVRVLQAAGRNGPGAGLLDYDATAGTLAWRAPGSATFGTAVTLAGDGEYLLLDGDDADKWLRVQVYDDWLPPATTQAQVNLSDLFNTPVSSIDVSYEKALSGDVAAWTVDLNNQAGETIHGLVAWLDADTDYLELSWDGSTWSAPTTEGAAIAAGDLADAASATLHVRRTIPAETACDPAAAVLIHLGFETFYADLRGLYRIFNAAEYRLYRSDSAPPEEGSTPWTTSPTLPVTPDDTFADGTWYVALSYFNGVLDSGFLPVGPRGEPYRVLGIDSGVTVLAPPAGPGNWDLAAVGLSVRVTAVYRDDSALGGQQWAIAYTFDGSDPPEDTPAITARIPTRGLAILEQLLPAASLGDTVKVRLQTRRNDGTVLMPIWRYSAGSVVKSIVLPSAGPTAPIGGAQTVGRDSEA